jgi:hypothetical protein
MRGDFEQILHVTHPVRTLHFEGFAPLVPLLDIRTQLPMVDIKIHCAVGDLNVQRLQIDSSKTTDTLAS